MFDACPETVRRWEVLRVSAGHVTRVMILADRMLPVTAHWIGISVMCAQEDCDLCVSLDTRGLWYLPVLATHGNVMLLELSAVSSANLEQHAKLMRNGLQPGDIYELKRLGAKSPVRAEHVDTKTCALSLTLLEVASRVAVLYRLPRPLPGETMESYQSRLQVACVNRNRYFAAKLLGGGISKDDLRRDRNGRSELARF